MRKAQEYGIRRDTESAEIQEVQEYRKRRNILNVKI